MSASAPFQMLNFLNRGTRLPSGFVVHADLMKMTVENACRVSGKPVPAALEELGLKDYSLLTFAVYKLNQAFLDESDQKGSVQRLGSILDGIVSSLDLTGFAGLYECFDMDVLTKLRCQPAFQSDGRAEACREFLGAVASSTPRPTVLVSSPDGGEPYFSPDYRLTSRDGKSVMYSRVGSPDATAPRALPTHPSFSALSQVPTVPKLSFGLFVAELTSASGDASRVLLSPPPSARSASSPWRPDDPSLQAWLLTDVDPRRPISAGGDESSADPS